MIGKIGVTERADPTASLGWRAWVAEGKPAILITKMPRLLLPLLHSNDNIIVHCTITGLGGTAIEPKIDSTNISLVAYHMLCRLLTPQRVVLRIDPIMNTTEDCTRELIALEHEAEGRVRISFMDAYPHVRRRFEAAQISLGQASFHQPLEVRQYIWESLGKPEVCAEPGLPSTPCVGVRDCRVLGVKSSMQLKGQRRECSCLANKFELCTPPCIYDCLYCYWKRTSDYE